MKKIFSIIFSITIIFLLCFSLTSRNTQKTNSDIDINNYIMDIDLQTKENSFKINCIVDFSVYDKKADFIKFSINTAYKLDKIIIDNEELSREYLINNNYLNSSVLTIPTKYLNNNSSHILSLGYNGFIYWMFEDRLLDMISDTYAYVRPEIKWYPSKLWEKNFSIYPDTFSATLRFYTKKDYDIISIGRLKSTDIKDNRKITVWQTDEPVCSMAFAGYSGYKNILNETNFTIYTNYQNKAVNSLSVKISKILDFYKNAISEKNGKINFVEISPDYKGGHSDPGLIMLGTPGVFYNDMDIESERLLAHEISHQWWGNSVNFNSFQDGDWLCESIAEFYSWYYLETLYPDTFIMDMKMRHSINRYISFFYLLSKNRPTPLLKNSDSFIPYTKGAIFIYEWYKRLGKDKFDLFMKKIFNKNNYSSLSVDNFLNELQSFIKSDSTQKINFKEIVDFYLNDTNVYISNDINKNPDSILFAIGETEFKKTINKNKMLNNLDKYFKDKNWKELLLISDNLLSLDLSNDEFGLVYFYKGLALSKTKNFIESKSLLLKSLEFLPASHWTSAWAHNTIGEILFNEKKYEEAENHFKKTIEINATNNSVKTAKYFLKQIHKNE